MHVPLALRLLAVAFLVAANAFFVASEFVLVSIRATRLKQLEAAGHSGARTALKLHGQIDQVLSATQLGITLASLALGWIGEHAVAETIMPLFSPLNAAVRPAIVHTIAIVVAFTIITAMHLVLGEVVPKNVALGGSADRLALLIARPMDLFIQVTHPFLRVMDAAAAGISALFGAASATHRHAHSPEELKMLITAGREGGILQERLEGMAHGVFDLQNIMVREVMVPRPDILSVPVNISLDDLVRNIIENQHSRVPVWEGTPEHFVGLLYVKDLFWVWRERQLAQQAGRPFRRFNLRHLLRDVLIVPETKSLDELLREFQERRRHLALAVDEFGVISGLVSVEDILERIVGEIGDEYDAEEPPLPPMSPEGLVLDGTTHIREIEERYDIALPRDEGYETLAGFLMSRLGRIPRPGDTLDFDEWRYTVEEMDHHRVATVKLERVTAETSGAG